MQNPVAEFFKNTPDEEIRKALDSVWRAAKGMKNFPIKPREEWPSKNQAVCIEHPAIYNGLYTNLLIVVEFIEQLLKAQIMTTTDSNSLTDISIDILSSIYDIYGEQVSQECMQNKAAFDVLDNALLIMHADTDPDGDRARSLAAEYIISRFNEDGFAPYRDWSD